MKISGTEALKAIVEVLKAKTEEFVGTDDRIESAKMSQSRLKTLKRFNSPEQARSHEIKEEEPNQHETLLKQRLSAIADVTEEQVPESAGLMGVLNSLTDLPPVKENCRGFSISSD